VDLTGKTPGPRIPPNFNIQGAGKRGPGGVGPKNENKNASMRGGRGIFGGLFYFFLKKKKKKQKVLPKGPKKSVPRPGGGRISFHWKGALGPGGALGPTKPGLYCQKGGARKEGRGGGGVLGF